MTRVCMPRRPLQRPSAAVPVGNPPATALRPLAPRQIQVCRGGRSRFRIGPGRVVEKRGCRTVGFVCRGRTVCRE